LGPFGFEDVNVKVQMEIGEFGNNVEESKLQEQVAKAVQAMALIGEQNPDSRLLWYDWVKDKVQIDRLDPGQQLSLFLSCPSPFHLFFINIFLFNYTEK